MLTNASNEIIIRILSKEKKEELSCLNSRTGSFVEEHELLHYAGGVRVG